MKTATPSPTPNTPPTRRTSTNWTIPKPGDVIAYVYLWRHEHERGDEEGSKVRPCVVIAVTPKGDRFRVIVCPITTADLDPNATVTLEPGTLTRLGLGPHARAICDDLNIFSWTGPDLRRTERGAEFYGAVPPSAYHRIRNKILAINPVITRRTE